jgi:tungstate transport system permease protein
MQLFSESLQTAFYLIISGNSDLFEIIMLSIKVSLTSLFGSIVIGLPLGAFLAIHRFRLRSIILSILNALMGMPPVVVGLIVYLYLSRSGPLGFLSLLYTPTAMIIAQVIIIFPIVTSLSHEIFDQNWREYKDQLRSINMTFFGVLFIISKHSYFLVITALLSAFGRAISEVGAVMIVGGNINHFTRVMTTAISLETRMGNLEYAMALGIVLILLTVLIYSLVYILNKRKI